MRWLVVLIVSGCAGAANAPEACLAPRLAQVETARIAEAVDKCKATGWSACPEHAAIESKYDLLRDQAVKECQ